MKKNFVKSVLSSSKRLAMPVAVYPGLELVNYTVKELVSNSTAQFEAISGIHKRYNMPFVLTAMDLSLEAEAFGCQIQMVENDIPTVEGRLATDAETIKALKVPELNVGRAHVPLGTVKKIQDLPGKPFVMGGIIGPFSLAARIFGVSETMELSLLEPDALHALLKKTTEYISNFATAFKDAGADGVVMAEPASGLMWPNGLKEFASAYIKQIVKKVQDNNFQVVFHNCGSTLAHLDAILESGVNCLHLGITTDIVQALEKVPENIIISGNLDPSATFVSGTPELVFKETTELLNATKKYSNFIISSGCDIPPNAKLENVDAFFKAVEKYNCR